MNYERETKNIERVQPGVDKRSLVVVTGDKIITGNVSIQQYCSAPRNTSITAILNDAGMTHPQYTEKRISHSNKYVNLSEPRIYPIKENNTIRIENSNLFVPINDIIFAFGDKKDYVPTNQRKGPSKEEEIAFYHDNYILHGTVRDFDQVMAPIRQDKPFLSLQRGKIRLLGKPSAGNLVDRLNGLGFAADEGFYTVKKDLIISR